MEVEQLQPFPNSSNGTDAAAFTGGKMTFILCFKFFNKDFIYFIFKQRGRGESEGQKHQCVVASCMPPNGDLA